MSIPHRPSTHYRAEIDGLRAIAVLAVLFFHAGLGFPGGYVGVDVFFVISGYLITGLILKDLDQFEILAFWERRVRRILPALVVVVLACLATGWFVLLPLDFRELGQSAVAQAMLVANVYFWRESGYFAQAGELKPLLHTWSLAVEEQFYLLFPFLLIALRRRSPRFLIATILLLGGLSFGLSVYSSYFHPSENFYLLPTRAWELLLGSFLAANPAPRTSPRGLMESLSWAGILAISCAVFGFDRETRFPGVTALLPCLGTAGVIWANRPTLTSVGRILTARPFVFVGLISYSLYLWHWPVLVFSRYLAIGELSQVQRLLLLVASFILAVLSWRFVETPFRQRVILKGRAPIFLFASIAAAVVLLAGFAIHHWQGVPARISAEALQYAAGKADRAFLGELELKDVSAGHFIELGTGNQHQPIELFVWGDSHAMAAMPMLDLLCKEHAVRGVAATHSSIAPLVGYESRETYSPRESIAFNQAVVETIRRERVGHVLLAACWDDYVARDGTARLRRGLVETIQALEGSGARIWIMRDVPKHHREVPRALASAILRGLDPESLGLPLAAHREANRFQDQLFAGIPASNVTILDPTDLFVTSDQRCRVAKDGKALYCDEEHLSVAGAMLLRPLFTPLFRSLGETTPPNDAKAMSR